MTLTERLQQITDELPGHREAASRTLCDDVVARKVVPTRNDIPALLRALALARSLGDDGTWRVLVELTLLCYPRLWIEGQRADAPTLAGQAGAALATAVAPARHLGTWLLEPFGKPSLVLDVCDPTGGIRDERAVSDFAFLVPQSARAGAEQRTIPLGRFKSSPERLGKIDALLFMGRLGLFGPDVPDRWCMEKPRFRFVTETRPPDLEPGRLDPEGYHRILVKTGPGDRTRSYCTWEKGPERTDYGLIQRYVRRVNDHSYFVVRCAGLSSPGSRAAARWIASLFNENQATGMIPLPDSAKPESRLEAVVEVKAYSPRKGPPWTIQSTKLMELYLDDQQWYESDSCWGPVTPRAITVVCDAGLDHAYSHDSAKEVWFDGDKRRFHGNSATRQHLLSFCRIAYENQGLVDVDQFKAEMIAWGEGTEDAELMDQRIKSAVATLKKRYFRRAVTDADDGWWLTADIGYEFLGNPSAESRRKAAVAAGKPTGASSRPRRSKRRPR